MKFSNVLLGLVSIAVVRAQGETTESTTSTTDQPQSTPVTYTPPVPVTPSASQPATYTTPIPIQSPSQPATYTPPVAVAPTTSVQSEVPLIPSPPSDPTATTGPASGPTAAPIPTGSGPVVGATSRATTLVTGSATTGRPPATVIPPSTTSTPGATGSSPRRREVAVQLGLILGAIGIIAAVS